MGSPLSKCCAEDTTVVKGKTTTRTKVVKTATTATASSSTATSSAVASSSIEPVASYVPPKVDASTKAANKSGSFFKRVSGSLASITDGITGQRHRSIEQGLKDFPYPLTEEERKMLLANEIPSSEIKKLSIGVDSGGMGIIHVAEYNGIKVAIKEASVHVISKEVCAHVPPHGPCLVWPAFSAFCLVPLSKHISLFILVPIPLFTPIIPLPFSRPIGLWPPNSFFFPNGCSMVA